jgi:hypothetical protein
MPVPSIPQWWYDTFSSRVHHKAGQTKSRMEKYSEKKMIKGDRWFYNSISGIEANESTSRYKKVVFSDIDHQVRQFRRRKFTVHLPVDEEDLERVLTDPKSEYIKQGVAALNRKKDQILREAALADVVIGKESTSTLSFAADGGLTVDMTAGATYDKLLEVNQNYIDAEVINEDDEEQRIFLPINGKTHTQLMKETNLTSGDYVRELVVEGGRMQKAAGIELIKYGANPTTHSSILPTNGSNQVESFSGVSESLVLGIGHDIRVKIKDRADLEDTMQISISLTLGALRKSGELIQKVLYTP